MSDVIDWELMSRFVLFTTQCSTEIFPDNLMELKLEEKELKDWIIYTTHKNDLYSVNNYVEELNPTSIAKEKPKTTYLDYIKDPDMRSKIDLTQPLISAHIMSPNLHILVHDFLYPDISTIEQYANQADGYQSMVVDFSFTNERTPQRSRTVNEQGWDWVVEDIVAPTPIEPLFQSVEVEEDVSSSEQAISKSSNVMLIPQVTRCYPMRLSFFHSLRNMPSILNYLKHVHSLTLFSDFLYDRTKVRMSREELIEAFTSKDICTFFNYDILETYGDAFIKFFVQTYLVLFSGYTSSELYTRKKSFMVSNRNLANLGNQIHIENVINIRQNSNSWGQAIPSYNIVADVVEALIGAVCFHHTPQDAARVVGYIIRLKEFVPSVIHTIEKGYISDTLMRLIEINNLLRTEGYEYLIRMENGSSPVERLGQIQDHVYQYPQLAALALYIDDSSTEVFNYQVLEFLGDGVLEWIIISIIIEIDKRHQAPRNYAGINRKTNVLAISPHTITMLKSNILNNDSFAQKAVSIHLHEALLYANPQCPVAIQNQIKDYAQWMTSPLFDPNWNKVFIREYLECFQIIHQQNLVIFPNGIGSGTRGKKEATPILSFITPVTVRFNEAINHIAQAPKMLGAVFESTIGALFLECGLEECTKRYSQLFAKEVRDGIVTGSLQVDAMTALIDLMKSLGISEESLNHKKEGWLHTIEISEKNNKKIVLVTMQTAGYSMAESVAKLYLYKHVFKVIYDAVKKAEQEIAQGK